MALVLRKVKRSVTRHIRTFISKMLFDRELYCSQFDLNSIFLIETNFLNHIIPASIRGH